MAYAVGQEVEVCLEFDLSLGQGVRLVIATFVNEHGDIMELTEMPGGVSECFLQKPTQISLRGQAACPGFYKMERLRVEHLSGITHMDPPSISFEVKGTPEVSGWRLA